MDEQDALSHRGAWQPGPHVKQARGPGLCVTRCTQVQVLKTNICNGTCATEKTHCVEGGKQLKR